MSWLKVFAVWLAEIINGTLRTLFLVPSFGDFRARQISVFTGSIMILAIIFLTVRWIGTSKTGSLLAIGFIWLLLTLIFEISLGCFIFDYSWMRIGEEFNVLRGGLLPFGLIILLLAPIIAARLRKV